MVQWANETPLKTIVVSEMCPIFLPFEELLDPDEHPHNVDRKAS